MKPRFKPTPATLLKFTGIPAAFALAASGHAAEIAKDGVGTNLSLGTSWAGGTAPGSSDVASWITGSLRSGLSFGSETTWNGIKVRGTGGITIGAGSLLNLGASGMDVSIGSGAALNFTNTLNVTSNQTWTIGGSTGLGFNSGSALTGSSTITVTGAGFMNSRANMTNFSGTLDYGLTSRLEVQGNHGTWSNVNLNLITGIAVGANGFTGTMGIGSLASTNASSSLGGGSQNGSMTYQVGALNQSTTFAGRINNGTSGGTFTTSFSKVGTGVLTLTSENSTYTGTTTISAGAIKLGHAAAISTSSAVTVNSNNGLRFGTGITAATLKDLGGTGALDLINDDTNAVLITANNETARTLSGVISGTGGLVKNGAGTLTLSSANQFSGGVTLGAGAIILGNAGALGTGAIQLAGGTLNQGALSISNAIHVTGTANLTYSGNQFGSSSALSGGGTLNVTGSGSSVNLGFGDMTNFTGTLNILGGNFRKGTNSGSGAAATVDIIGTSTSIAQYSRHGFVGTDHIGALSGNEYGILSGGNGTMTYSIGALNTDTTYSGLIRNGSDGEAVRVVSLAKTGTGTLTLDGANTYTGTTTVINGTLLVNGTNNGNGTVTVASGATLGGTGTIKGAIEIQNGAVLAAGDVSLNSGIGKLAAEEGLSLQSGSIFSWDLSSQTSGSRGTDFDALDVTGPLEISATNTIFKIIIGGLDLGSAFWNEGQSWNIFNRSSTGTFASFELYDSEAQTHQVTYSSRGTFTFNDSSGALEWSAVPEPSGALACLLIGSGLMRRRRKN